jgi:hypothetical protein
VKAAAEIPSGIPDDQKAVEGHVPSNRPVSLCSEAPRASARGILAKASEKSVGPQQAVAKTYFLVLLINLAPDNHYTLLILLKHHLL